MRYHFIPDVISSIPNLAGQIISRISCVTTKEFFENYIKNEKIENNMIFSISAYRYYIEFSDSYTFALRSARGGYRSVMLAWFENFPNEEEIKRDIVSNDPVLIEAGDERYSNTSIENLLGRKIVGVDFAIQENPRFPYRRFNQKGLIFTDDHNQKFTIFWGSLDQMYTHGMFFSNSDYFPEEFGKTYYFKYD